MLLKAGIEIFKVLSRIGVKPKDVIGTVLGNTFDIGTPTRS